MAKAFPTQDVIIEVLDARMPHASANPIVTALRKHKPCIKLLNKADLADPDLTREWVRSLESEGHVSTLDPASGRVIVAACSSERLGEMKQKLPGLCESLVGRRGSPLRMVRAMVVGIPNVGKSTLINALMGRKVAKVGDEPAVTKTPQQVSLACGILLSDNPGLLWPNIEDPIVGLKLALGGAIADAAIDYEAVARYGAKWLLERYAELIMARYKLEQRPSNGDELLAQVGRQRGCLRSGNIIDWHKAADVLIHDLRRGVIGRVSLESPKDVGSDLSGAFQQPLAVQAIQGPTNRSQ